MLYQLSYASLLSRHGHWSGRRESNPQPTAWKAVTLPLSYSRLGRKTALSFYGKAAQAVNFKGRFGIVCILMSRPGGRLRIGGSIVLLETPIRARMLVLRLHSNLVSYSRHPR